MKATAARQRMLDMVGHAINELNRAARTDDPVQSAWALESAKNRVRDAVVAIRVDVRKATACSCGHQKKTHGWRYVNGGLDGERVPHCNGRGCTCVGFASSTQS